MIHILYIKKCMVCGSRAREIATYVTAKAEARNHLGTFENSFPQMYRMEQLGLTGYDLSLGQVQRRDNCLGIAGHLKQDGGSARWTSLEAVLQGRWDTAR